MMDIYKWVMKDQKPAEIEADPIIRKARTQYNLYLTSMPVEEKQEWEFYQKKGREMVNDALKKYRKKSDARQSANYFSLENTAQINRELFEKDSLYHASIFNEIRKYFLDKPYDRERVLSCGQMEKETVILNRYWKNARENVVKENQKMKKVLAMKPEDLNKLKTNDFDKLKLNLEDVLALRKLEKKYFNNSFVEQDINKIEQIVTETEQLRERVEHLWKAERIKRGQTITNERELDIREDYER